MPRLCYEKHFSMPPKSLRKIKRPKHMYMPYKILTLSDNVAYVNISPSIKIDGVDDYVLNCGGLDNVYSGMDINYV